MLRSLRFRLPALFLAGIAAAGIVSVAIAFQLLQNYSRSQSLKELRREASGLNLLLVGLLVAGGLAWSASRRIARPLLGLSDAADEIARGHYDVPMPQVQGAGEIGHLADRFREMAARLAETEERERNFLMTVSHE